VLFLLPPLPDEEFAMRLSKRIRILTVVCTLTLASTSRADLVGLYRFDAEADPQPDSTTNGQSAALMNDAKWVDDASRGGAMSFDGTGDHLLVQDTDKLSITGDMTIAAWAKFTQFDNWNSIVSKTGDAEPNKPAPYDLYTANNGSGLMTMFVGNGSTSLAPFASTTAAALGEWQHIAVTVTAAGEITHYLNGELNGQGTVAVTREDRNTNLFIGSRADGVTNMNGLLDDVAIFDEVLSPADIKTVMGGDFTPWGVPEPGSISLLLLGSVLVLGRLKRTHCAREGSANRPLRKLKIG
jgi:hypothetical protein